MKLACIVYGYRGYRKEHGSKVLRGTQLVQKAPLARNVNVLAGILGIGEELGVLSCLLGLIGYLLI